MILLKRKIELWTSDELRDLIMEPRQPEGVRRKALAALEARRLSEGWREGHDEGCEDGQRIPGFRA